MEHKKFHYQTREALEAELAALGVSLPLAEDLSPLGRPVAIGNRTAANAIAIQPMEGCDGTADGCPAVLTLRRYDRFAQSEYARLFPKQWRHLEYLRDTKELKKKLAEFWGK